MSLKGHRHFNMRAGTKTLKCSEKKTKNVFWDDELEYLRLKRWYSNDGKLLNSNCSFEVWWQDVVYGKWVWFQDGGEEKGDES